MPVPTSEQWGTIASKFLSYYQFPNCIGAIDGKHVAIQAPSNSGATYRNYKGFFSIVLLALVDADKCFTVIDVGGYGKNSDGGILQASALGLSLEAGTLNIPEPKPLPGTSEIMPHVIIGDEAFPLKTNLLRPYPGTQAKDSASRRIFNYRLSRARNVVENAFGILTARWGVYQRTMKLAPDSADKIVRATCVLHNYLQQQKRANHESDNDLQGTSNACANIAHFGYHANQQAYDVRDKFREYFMSPSGAVSWQDNIILHGFKHQ